MKSYAGRCVSTTVGDNTTLSPKSAMRRPRSIVIGEEIDDGPESADALQISAAECKCRTKPEMQSTFELSYEYSRGEVCADSESFEMGTERRSRRTPREGSATMPIWSFCRGARTFS